MVVAIAKAAKEAGVKQFILLSSMSVYGMVSGQITKKTKPKPNTAYGMSKFQADEMIKKIENDILYLHVCVHLWFMEKIVQETIKRFASLL